MFHAYQTVEDRRELIYHTNVMMTLTENYVIICLDSIDNKKEQKQIIKNLLEDGREIIKISEDQVNNFAGNMLQVIGKDNIRYTVMSEAAFKSLSKDQIAKIEEYSTILYSNLETIETCGGGSARCMMAEVFLKHF